MASLWVGTPSPQEFYNELKDYVEYQRSNVLELWKTFIERNIKTKGNAQFNSVSYTIGNITFDTRYTTVAKDVVFLTAIVLRRGTS